MGYVQYIMRDPGSPEGPVKRQGNSRLFLFSTFPVGRLTHSLDGRLRFTPIPRLGEKRPARANKTSGIGSFS
jgi:hypothetical protein